MKESNELKENSKNESKNILLLVLKKHKISLFFVLFFCFASVSFAWFIYNKTVSMGMTAHVKSWKVFLGDGDDGDTYVIELSDLYPGMDSIDGDSIPISNDGEMDADVAISISSLSLFGEEQTIGSNTDTCDATLKDTADYVCDYKIVVSTEANTGRTIYSIEGYPFKLKFYLGGSTLSAGQMSSLNYSLEWDYESCEDEDDTSCDELDTWYGEKSYEFNKKYLEENPDLVPEIEAGTKKIPSLEVTMTLTFTEKN